MHPVTEAPISANELKITTINSLHNSHKINNRFRKLALTFLYLLGSFPFVTSANTHNSCYAVEPSCPDSSKNVI